ncbi:conjugal transfer pilus assembly protein TraK [Novosphingobium sp. 1748]|uniref:type-F conjugative transfer system secretin TraK n=1 Tax=Novosphingobium sp. 1748 TaxID=2817760 RepID=UPI002861ADC5|nr:type-F conjugative transfer system secretin TraK [Novosphingobium sp. 1748]MDR6709291.1 conjugal transfer pilus assembly protein TraK [Novosphingobium sp. 1748]
MPKPINPGIPARALLSAVTLLMAMPAGAQTIRALPEQTSRIRLSNRDINHVVCEGGEIEDVKFSQEKGLAVEKGGSDAWIKFLVRQIDDAGQVTRSYVTQPSEFFIACNGATYPLYAEPADIPAQTILLTPGARQRAKANSDLLAPLADEDRAVSITMAMLGNRVPASFSEVAPSDAVIRLSGVASVTLAEHRRLAIEGSGFSASEYWVRAAAPVTLEERAFLDPALGEHIFSLTFDRSRLAADESARLIVIRRETKP